MDGQVNNWTYFGTHILFDIAKEACQRSTRGKPERAPNHDALVAIVFAASTLEAWMSQAISSARRFTQAHPKVEFFAELLGQLDSRDFASSLKTKYYIAHWIVAGKKPDKGTEPYQSFNLLVDLRNALVHFKPDKPNPKKKIDKILVQLRNKGLLSGSLPSDPRTLWVFYVSNPLVATWACNSAAAMIQHFEKCTSEERLRVFFRTTANTGHYNPFDEERGS